MIPETVETSPSPAVVQPPLVRRLREMRDVQGSQGNWNYDAYMHGMYNGMEYALALMEERDPEFKAAPPEWLADRSVSAEPDLGQWLGAEAVAAIESSTNVEVLLHLPGGAASTVGCGLNGHGRLNSRRGRC